MIKCTFSIREANHKQGTGKLKGLAMIFAGQENPFIIFRSKEIYIYLKTNNKIPHKFVEITKKTGCLVSFILEGTLTVFLISQNFSFIMFGAFEIKEHYF